MMRGSSDTPGVRDVGETHASARYRPALDGLRALCVLAVLFFHADFVWMQGGFLGVSTFFTLSGYLILTLLLRERETQQPIRLRDFWDRRLRRLLPASLLALGMVTVTAPWWVDPAQRETLPWDIIWTLGYAVNWRFISEEYAYALLFTDPSPVQHFWSLAIEGQFYLLFPLLVGGLLNRGRSLGQLAIAIAVLAGLSAGLSWAYFDGAETFDRIYYGSDTRAAEILIGGLLAIALRAGVPAGFRRPLAWASLASLALLISAWIGVTLDSEWLYRGGLPLYGLVSAIAIAGATQAEGPVARLLSARWLTGLGKISYGVYLFHWPIYLIVTPESLGVFAPACLALRLAATLALAGVSYRFVERPVRSGAALRGARGAVVGLAAIGAVALTSIWTAPDGFIDTRPSAYTQQSEIPEGVAVRIATYGDSTVLRISTAIGQWIQQRSGDDEFGFRIVRGYTELGCGLLAASVVAEARRLGIDPSSTLGLGAVRRANGGKLAATRMNKRCEGFLDRISESVAGSRPHVAVVMFGPWEVAGVRLPGELQLRTLGDPVLDPKLHTAIHSLVDILTQDGARVLWLTPPEFTPAEYMEFDRPRLRIALERFNQILRGVARERRGSLEVLEFAEYLEAWPGGLFDEKLRDDGVHLTFEASVRIGREWLGPQILERFSASPH